MAPFGSQWWLAWPELGIGLYADRHGSGLRLQRFRGDRMASEWPDRMVRGDFWPFDGVWEHKARRDRRPLHGPTRVDPCPTRLLTRQLGAQAECCGCDLERCGTDRPVRC